MAMLVVFTTTPDKEEANRLAREIVDAKLAACVQVLPSIRSYYFWAGEIRSETEHLLLIKTVERCYKPLEKFIGERHSYEIPEVVAVPAEKVSPPYLDWMNEYLIDA